MSPTADAPDWAVPNAAQLIPVQSGVLPLGDTVIDVSAWASVVVKLASGLGGSLLAARYTFTTTDGTVIDQGLLSCNTQAATGAAWELPVSAAVLVLSRAAATNENYAVFGSNIPARGKRMLSDFLPLRSFTLNGGAGVAANTFTYLNGGPVDGSTALNDLTGYNGDCDFVARVFTIGGTAQWDFLAEIFNYDGTFGRYLYTSLTAAATVTFTKAHPRAWVRWLARNTTATTGAWSLELDVIPKALA